MSTIDPRTVSFSVAQGYVELPMQLKLEELTNEARIAIWNSLYQPVIDSFADSLTRREWASIIRSVYGEHFGLPLDRLSRSSQEATGRVLQGPIHTCIIDAPFNEVFDLLTFVMRKPECPHLFITSVSQVFQDHLLAYRLDTDPPPTIYPIATQEEGIALVSALDQIKSAGLPGAHGHLQQAAVCINQQDWAGAVRESIHAVESVARQIAPGSGTLGEALSTLEQKGMLQHPALKQGFANIYGYTNDEQGIRHALLNQSSANVGQDEAIFMFGACASFASYLSRKQMAT